MRKKLFEKEKLASLFMHFRFALLFLTNRKNKMNLSANEAFVPLNERLTEIKDTFNSSTEKEIKQLKKQIKLYLKYVPIEEKINTSEKLISEMDNIYNHFKKEFEPNPSASSQVVRVKRRISSYTHISVFDELSDYKDFLNKIINETDSASFIKNKNTNSNSHFQLDLNVQQFAALFYFLHQEKLLDIPDGKKREFAKAITSVFHTKGQKNVSVKSFVNKFSKPEIEAADYWAVEFTKLKMAAKKID